VRHLGTKGSPALLLRRGKNWKWENGSAAFQAQAFHPSGTVLVSDGGLQAQAQAQAQVVGPPAADPGTPIAILSAHITHLSFIDCAATSITVLYQELQGTWVMAFWIRRRDRDIDSLQTRRH
jgi:hypothetical protein